MNHFTPSVDCQTGAFLVFAPVWGNGGLPDVQFPFIGNANKAAHARPLFLADRGPRDGVSRSKRRPGGLTHLFRIRNGKHYLLAFPAG